MTFVHLTASRVDNSEVWIVDPLPQAVLPRESGLWISGYPESVARRLAAAWNSSLPYSVEELEAGGIQAEHDALEFACEKIRLQQVLVEGCSLHPSYRAKQAPRSRIYCPACERMWEAAQALKEMSARTQSEPIISYEEYMKQHIEWAEVTSQEPGMHQVSIRNQRKALVEEKPDKGVQADGN